MDMRKPSIDWTSRLLACGLTAFLLLPAGQAAAATAGRITATLGEAEADDSALSLRGSLEEGAALETGEDGGCSLLVDGDAVMEVCGDTLLRLERKGGKPDGARVVRLDRGSIRMVVEPRLGEERVEIHTPAAIATVLGTIVHVSVNELGVAEITSEASRVQINSTNPNEPGTKILEAGQSITIAVDGTFGEIVDLEFQEIQALGGCYVGLHDVPLVADRGRASSSKIEELVENDVIEADLPDVADSGGDSDFDPPGPEDWFPSFPPEANGTLIDCPPGLPGETCF
jgi:hypothetical protein